MLFKTYFSYCLLFSYINAQFTPIYYDDKLIYDIGSVFKNSPQKLERLVNQTVFKAQFCSQETLNFVQFQSYLTLHRSEFETINHLPTQAVGGHPWIDVSVYSKSSSMIEIYDEYRVHLENSLIVQIDISGACLDTDAFDEKLVHDRWPAMKMVSYDFAERVDQMIPFDSIFNEEKSWKKWFTEDFEALNDLDFYAHGIDSFMDKMKNINLRYKRHPKCLTVHWCKELHLGHNTRVDNWYMFDMKEITATNNHIVFFTDILFVSRTNDSEITWKFEIEGVYMMEHGWRIAKIFMRPEKAEDIGRGIVGPSNKQVEIAVLVEKYCFRARILVNNGMLEYSKLNQSENTNFKDIIDEVAKLWPVRVWNLGQYFDKDNFIGQICNYQLDSYPDLIKYWALQRKRYNVLNATRVGPDNNLIVYLESSMRYVTREIYNLNVKNNNSKIYWISTTEPCVGSAPFNVKPFVHNLLEDQKMTEKEFYRFVVDQVFPFDNDTHRNIFSSDFTAQIDDNAMFYSTDDFLEYMIRLNKVFRSQKNILPDTNTSQWLTFEKDHFIISINYYFNNRYIKDEPWILWRFRIEAIQKFPDQWKISKVFMRKDLISNLEKDLVGSEELRTAIRMTSRVVREFQKMASENRVTFRSSLRKSLKRVSRCEESPGFGFQLNYTLTERPIVKGTVRKIGDPLGFQIKLSYKENFYILNFKASYIEKVQNYGITDVDISCPMNHQLDEATK